MRNSNLLVLAMVALGAFALGGLLPRVGAQGRSITLEGSCDRGDVLVFDGSDRARCVDADELAYPRCDEGAFLTTSSGELRCVGPSTTPWGARGLLPVCNDEEIVVSEGFGRWRCQAR
jgi:hypothetical protein